MHSIIIKCPSVHMYTRGSGSYDAVEAHSCVDDFKNLLSVDSGS